MRQRVLWSWSSGKDSAWGLHVLRRSGAVEVAGLLTAVNGESGAAPMHETPPCLLDAQAEAAGLPLFKVHVPDPFDPIRYAREMTEFLSRAKEQGVTAVAFGDLHLADLRQAREEKLAAVGLEALFPLWGRPTDALAREMIAGGLRAKIVCVDTRVLPASLAGAEFDEPLLSQLPHEADPCGERGEFHTFAWAGPMFGRPVEFQTGPLIATENFARVPLCGREGPARIPPWVPLELRRSMNFDELASDASALCERDQLAAALEANVAAFAARARGKPRGLCAVFEAAELSPAQLTTLKEAESRFPGALFVAYARPLRRRSATPSVMMATNLFSPSSRVPPWVPPDLRRSMDLDELASDASALSERDQLAAALGANVAAYAARARGKPHGLCAVFEAAELSPAQLTTLREAESRFPGTLFVAYARPLRRRHP